MILYDDMFKPNKSYYITYYIVYKHYEIMYSFYYLEFSLFPYCRELEFVIII